MEAPNLGGDRWLVISKEDQRGKVLVVAIICCVYCPMILALRAVSSLKHLGVNDFLAVTATLTGVIQYAIMFAGVARGLGRSFDVVSLSDGRALGRLVIASELLFFATLMLTKCSIVALFRRLFSVDMKRYLVLCDVVSGICVVWGLGAMLTATVNCDPLAQIGYEMPFCSNLSARFTGIAIADAASEVLIFILSVVVVIPLQMAVARKVTVILSFLPRLVIIVLIALHAQSVQRQVTSSSSGTNLTDAIVYRQVQLIYSIMTATLPGINRSLRLFNTSIGNSWWKTTLTSSNGNHTGRTSKRSLTGGEGIPLDTIDKSRTRGAASATKTESSNSKPIRLRPDQGDYNITVSDARSGHSQDSTDSKARIIRKESQWLVEYGESTKTP